jgi:uncharacterized protein YndB with AHSA1/START domain
LSRGFNAVSTVSVHAGRTQVWDALVNPAKVKQYMHGTNLSSTWEVGSPITWSGEWKGKAYQDKGEILEFEPERLLAYTHWSPMGGSEDKPDNYHTVTCRLDERSGTTTLSLTQDNNATQAAADEMAATNWAPMLEGLKAVAKKA